MVCGEPTCPKLVEPLKVSLPANRSTSPSLTHKNTNLPCSLVNKLFQNAT